ncbi:hypothetical protein GCM10027062_26000 [Nocardioides hungaricus]
MSGTTSGRRSARRGSRVDLTTVLAVVLPVACALALLLVRPPEPADPSAAPTRTPLTRATAVCPSGRGDVAVTSAAPDVRGPVQVGSRAAQVATGRVASVDAGADPVVVSGEDDTAPGLVASRIGEGAAAACLPPSPSSWFAGVGSGAGHRSVLELTNPDSGPDSGTAVADVAVYGRRGVVDAPRLRGVSVPAGSSVRLDLSSIVPRRDELSLRVVAARGRIGATVLDRFDPLGRGATVTGWLPAQAEPSTSNLLLGIGPGTDARRILAVANGGPDEVLASIRVVTRESVFAPRDVPDLRVPPQSTARLRVTGALARALEGATGLLVTANEPVSTSLRTYVEGDLSHAVPDLEVASPAAVLVPEGEKRLLLAGASGAGSVEVVAGSAAGEVLATRRIEVVPGRGYAVSLPAGAVLVTVSPSRAAVSGAVLATGTGTSVVPLTRPATSGLVPAVRPGLP